MKKLALFDFDGTITTHDSFREFLLYSFGWRSFVAAVLLHVPHFFLYSIGFFSNHSLKERFSTYFFKNMSISEFEQLAQKFVVKRLTKIVRPSAMKKMLSHIKDGDRVVVVSASFEDYLKHWCQMQGIELIATKLEHSNGAYTGNILGKNCWGEEKVERIKQILDLNEYEKVYAYGDSRGDREMFSIADETGYRIF